MRLLLVEDEHDIQGFLKQALADAGYQVDVAPDGKSAEALATAHSYDILTSYNIMGSRWVAFISHSSARFC